MTRKTFLSFLIFVFLSIIVTFPLILKPTQITVAGREEFFLSYILNWNIHALTHFPLKIFQAPFFHPFKNTLAFSDPLFTSAIITLPFVKIFNQPFLAYTVNIFLSFVFNGFFTYLLVFKLTKNFYSSLISGLLVSFSIGRIDSLEHLQVFGFYWIPLGLYFFLNQQPKLTILTFILQTLNTVFLGFVHGFTLTVFSLVFFLKKKITKHQLLTLAKYFIFALIILVIIFIPYFQVSKTYQVTRSLKDIFGGSAYFLDYFYPTQTSRLQSLASQIINKQPWPAYLGAPILILALVTVFYVSSTPVVLASIISAFSGFIFSLGPYFQLTRHNKFLHFPLPYLWVYYLVPGFKSMRVPQRWSHLLLFSLALIIGLNLPRLFKKLKPSYIKIFTTLVALLIILEIRLPLFNQPVATRSQIPPVYHWLANQPSGTIVEIPAQTWVMKLSDIEIQRLHYRSFLLNANHKFINGFSGFSPPAWEDNISALRKFPQKTAIQTLQQLNANLVVIHHQDVAELKKQDIFTLDLSKMQSILSQHPDFSLAYEDSQTSVYTIYND
ncbi:hypothetical protein ACFL18_00470 [Patescibacteria group bacterium]